MHDSVQGAGKIEARRVSALLPLCKGVADDKNSIAYELTKKGIDEVVWEDFGLIPSDLLQPSLEGFRRLPALREKDELLWALTSARLLNLSDAQRRKGPPTKSVMGAFDWEGIVEMLLQKESKAWICLAWAVRSQNGG
ncbi:hypothetical protein WJX73_007280 [Symbiochloris irregularis]|uniref:Uncharacterized protein n=1 Tax=Symbiochloris irregularis TaxID=706552 RepID=A0AAW1NW65_9CHLO